MNRYETLADKLSWKLGPNYDIKYYENDQVTWEDVVEDNFNMIRGVCSLAGSDSTKLGGILVDTCNVPVSFLIPIENYNEAVSNIEKTMHDIHGEIFEWNSEYVQTNNSGRTEAEKVMVNGTEYAVTTVSLTLVAYTKAILGNEAFVKIGNVLLSGVSNITYQSQKQAEGVVLGNESPIQINKMAGVNKSLTIDLVLCRDDDLHIDLMENDSTNKKYEVSYYNGFITRNMKMSVLTLTEYVPIGNTIKGQLVLGIKEKGA